MEIKQLFVWKCTYFIIISVKVSIVEVRVSSLALICEFASVVTCEPVSCDMGCLACIVRVLCLRQQLREVLLLEFVI